MLRRISALAARRRVLALAAVLGAGVAMLAASPAVPASAAVVPVPAASGGSGTMSITVQPPASNMSLPAITCQLNVGHAFVAGNPGGGLHPNAFTTLATAQMNCFYPFNGAPAPVKSITLHNSLIYDDATVATGDGANSGQFELDTTASTVGCLLGEDDNEAGSVVEWPDEYNTGPWIGGYDVTSNIVSCPGQPVGCAVTCSGTGGVAGPAADAADARDSFTGPAGK